MKDILKDKNLTEKELNQRAKKLRSEYMKTWRDRNPEKAKIYRENFWLRKAIENYLEEVGENGKNEND